jgi:hypothetical protein
MPDTPRKLSSVVGTFVLFVLASPIFALRAIGSLFVFHRAAKVIRAGFIRCPSCGYSGNRLDVLIECRAKGCGWTEHRSLALPCSRCGERLEWIHCSECGASIALP